MRTSVAVDALERQLRIAEARHRTFESTMSASFLVNT